jgi:predicted short-subunit dehydrogenase-like oxidoreductase (DUF2520 family)
MKITLLGAGNVGTHLAIALHKAGFVLHQIYSRNAQLLPPLSHLCQAGTCSNLSALLPNSDIYLIAISDNAIASFAQQLHLPPTAIVAHTSGSMPMSALAGIAKHGIFYPLQTFSPNKSVNWATIPLLIQGSDPDTTQTLSQIAAQLSPHIYCLTDEQRTVIHLAAVLVNNFSNHLMTIAHDILQQHQLPFDILKPLILETAQKVQTQLPQQVQTGPAKRGDTQTINKHLQLLQTMPNDIQQLYRDMTQLISNYHQKNKE